MLGTATYPSLKSRNVFVTGGATGIGAALVRAFAGQGARVAFVDLAEEPAMLLCRQVAQETGELPLFRRVDVRDVAAGHARALAKGRPGERYLLGGPNWSLKEFFGRLERVAKVDGPRFKLGGRPATWGAIALERIYKAAGKDPPVDRVSVEMAEHFWYIDSARARRELGFDPRDPSLTLVDTVRYLRQGVETDL